MNKIGNFEKLVADLIADSEHGSELYDYIHQQGRLVDIRGGATVGLVGQILSMG